MQFVVNEWLLEYLCPNADKSERNSVLRFANAWVNKCDKMLIKRPSPFVSKFYRFMKQFGWDLDFKARFKKVNELLFRNPDKTIIVDETELDSLPAHLADKVPPDDRYLVELARFSADKTIITTDRRLKEILKSESDLKIVLFEEFMKDY